MKVKIEDWKEKIEEAWKKQNSRVIAQNVYFHEVIWEMSQTAFDIPREVQVVIDANAKLFISVGSPGFVSFEGQEEQLPGMKMPIIQWIHTHPFGDAYFSGRDLLTISMWERHLMQAIVLGKDEKMTMFFRVGKNGQHLQEYTQYTWIGDEEE
tara:strand:- start:140 stop:598 length:459 start_codon:yes stop_codon:yes gene_type:complete